MTILFTADEQTVINDIRRAGGFRSDDEALKGALFWFARFLDVDVNAEMFALGTTEARLVEPSPSTDQPDLFSEEAP